MSNEFNPASITGLDPAAWERWLAYRVSIKKPIKPASMHAAALKLSRFGDDQEAVVEQSVANGYQGLFDLKKSRPAPGEAPRKTREQVAADTARWEHLMNAADKSVRAQLAEPLGRLRMLDAVLARLSFQQDDPDYSQRLSRLRDAIAEQIAAADPAKVLGDPHLRSTVMQLWGEKGIFRLQTRAEKR